MTDTDKQVADQPKTDDQPKVDEQKVEAPQSDQGAQAPAGGGAQAGATDQHGRQLFEVDCSSCGNKAQVPFKPSGDRPVYCRDCYMKQRNDRPRRQF